MKRIIIKYHLELFTAVVLIFTIADGILFSEISCTRKLVNMFMILGVFHEWEEKRFPGGFYELMAKKFGIKAEKEGLDKAGLMVILYWLVITCMPYVFDQAAFLLFVPAVLGYFEAFIHTAGIFIHKMKRPYTPGLVSAWIMAAGSVYTTVYLKTNGLAGTVDYVLGVLLMFGGFLLMDLGVMRSVSMHPKDIPAKIRAQREQR